MLITTNVTTLCDNVCQWLAAGRWFSPDTPGSSINNIDRHDITGILLKVALNTITLIPNQRIVHYTNVPLCILTIWKQFNWNSFLEMFVCTA